MMFFNHAPTRRHYVKHLIGAHTRGHHFTILSPPAGRTEPGTLVHAVATCAHPLLPEVSGDSLSNSFTACSGYLWAFKIH